jgi:hypothetical protein
MTKDTPLPPLPHAPSAASIKTISLDDTFAAILLGPLSVLPDDFSNEWGTTNTEEALALSSVYDVRLKECIVAALASIWSVPMMHPAQLKACFCLLHTHRPYSQVVN